MSLRAAVLSAMCASLVLVGAAHADDAHREFRDTVVREGGVPKQYRETIARGLAYLAETQDRDGHWEDQGQNPTLLTALSGLALLMEGSNLREGKYRDNLRRATSWLMKRSQRNGQIGSASFPRENGRYMYGHGYAFLFLACVRGDEEDKEQRKQLQDVLERAAKFTREAQTRRGGWGYVSASEGGNFDEGSQAVAQVQALCAARDAGIALPKDVLLDAQRYLIAASATSSGGVKYTCSDGYPGDGGRPPLTAAALICGLNSGDYDSQLLKKWLTFSCKHLHDIESDRRGGVVEFTHYYFAQVMYALGDYGWAKLFPDTPKADCPTWTKYRTTTFDYLVRTQQRDGSWPASLQGTVYSTATFCSIMQLDNGALPIHQRRGLFAPGP